MMAKYRNHLPQLDGGVYLTDSGLETVLVFHKNFDLPHFAAFDLLRDATSKQVIHDYYRTHAEIARDAASGFVLWRRGWPFARSLARSLLVGVAALLVATLVLAAFGQLGVGGRF